MKIIRLSALFIILFSAIKINSQNIPIPELKGPVTDLTGTLELFEVDLLQQKLLNFQKNNGSQIVVVIIPTTGEESIEEYSMRLAEEWKIGSAGKDDGIILLVAKNDRKVRIEVGYGMEKTVTDANAGFIIDDAIVPEFKNGDFYTGINNGVDNLMGLITGEISFDTDKLGEINDASEEAGDKMTSNFGILFLILIVLLPMVPFFMIESKFYILTIVITINILLNYLFGLYLKDMTFGYVFMIVTAFIVFIPFLINLVKTLRGTKRHGGFWAGGSSSYSGGSWSSSSSSSSRSSSSSSSSYSGGGGSFGGGGASGSW